MLGQYSPKQAVPYSFFKKFPRSSQPQQCLLFCFRHRVALWSWDGIPPALVSVLLGLQFPSLANTEFVMCLYMCQFYWHCHMFYRNNKNNSTENAHLSRTQCHTSESRTGRASKPPSPLPWSSWCKVSQPYLMPPYNKCALKALQRL